MFFNYLQLFVHIIIQIILPVTLHHHSICKSSSLFFQIMHVKKIKKIFNITSGVCYLYYRPYITKTPKDLLVLMSSVNSENLPAV